MPKKIIPPKGLPRIRTSLSTPSYISSYQLLSSNEVEDLRGPPRNIYLRRESQGKRRKKPPRCSSPAFPHFGKRGRANEANVSDRQLRDRGPSFFPSPLYALFDRFLISSVSASVAIPMANDVFNCALQNRYVVIFMSDVSGSNASFHE